MNEMNPWMSLTISGFSSILSKTMFAPLERVKLLLQTQGSNHLLKDKPYRGIKDCIRRIITEEGVLAFWKGNTANLLRFFPAPALDLFFKKYFNWKFNVYHPETQTTKFIISSLLCGGIAGTGTTALLYPLDLTRTRMAVDISKRASSQFNGILHCMRSIYAKSGVTGLYSGLAISLPSIFIFRGLYLGIYDSGKGIIPNFHQSSMFFKYLFGLAVTLSSVTLAYPLDTIKRRMMMNSGLDKKLYSGTIDCVRTIFRNEGYAGFFKGNMINVIQILSAPLILMLYDGFTFNGSQEVSQDSK